MATFICPACRGDDFESVCVKMPSGVLRATDFFVCQKCRLMFFAPTVFDAGHPPHRTNYAGLLTRYGGGQTAARNENAPAGQCDLEPPTGATET